MGKITKKLLSKCFETLLLKVYKKNIIRNLILYLIHLKILSLLAQGMLEMLREKRKRSSASLTQDEIEKILNICNETTPNGLQRKFFHLVAYELAWRGGEGIFKKNMITLETLRAALVTIHSFQKLRKV